MAAVLGGLILRLWMFRAFPQLGGDVLIGPGRGLGPVPGPAIRISRRIGDLRQSGVHNLPVRSRR